MMSSADRDRASLLREKYSGKECPDFFIDLGRLREGEPLAYVIGWVDFLGTRVDLSRRPLIPRPETEWWVEAIIQKLKVKNNDLRILDLFAGSGCIGVSLAKHLSRVSVDCADIDPNALAQLLINAEQNDVSERVHAIESDVFANINETYDVIVANPPYIDRLHPEAAETSVLRFEPRTALFADESGLRYLRLLIEGAAAYLNGGGCLVAEFGKDQNDAVARLLAADGWHFEIKSDQFGIPRWFLAQRAL